jgi:hypothetical protein
LGGWSPLLTKPNYICKIFENRFWCTIWQP